MSATPSPFPDQGRPLQLLKRVAEVLGSRKSRWPNQDEKIAIKRSAASYRLRGEHFDSPVLIPPIHACQMYWLGTQEVAGNVSDHGGISSTVLTQIDNDRVEVCQRTQEC